MRTKRLGILGTLAVGGLFAFAGPVQAANVIVADPDLMFFPDDQSQVTIKLQNYESAFTGGWEADPTADNTETGSIGVGTFLTGIFQITSSGNGIDNRFGTDFELTGEFSAEVSRVESIGGGDAIFELVPDSNFEAEYGTGAMLAMFYDTTPDFSGIGTLTDSRDTAVDGSLYQVWGANDDWGDVNADGDGYFWGANGSTTPSVSAFAASLALLVNNSGILDSDFLQVTQAPPASGSGTFTNEAVLSTILNEFGLQGNTVANDLAGSEWDIRSEDPVTAHAVPVPGAGLAGLAMIGGVGLLRRRRAAA